MAIKKEALDNFFEEDLLPQKKPKYSSYRVFDNESSMQEKEDFQKKNKLNLITSEEQNHNKLGAKPETISKQLDNNSITKPITIGKQLSNDSITQAITIGKQLENKTHERRASNSLSALSGLQRKTLLVIYQNCKIIGGNTTSEITLDHLTSIVGSNKNCIKTTINRLRKKGFLETVEYKTGRGGWVVYRLPQFIYLDILKNEGLNTQGILLTDRINKPITQTITEPVTNKPSSSSNNNIYIKTTTGEIGNQISRIFEDWQNIDIDPLSDVGFTITHVKQIASQNKLTPQIVQDSIYAFAFDLQENNKAKGIKGEPINFFMGILRKGFPYNFPNNYESPKDKAMRIYRERAQEIEQKRAEEERQAIDLAFNDWFAKLTHEQKIEFLPEMLRRNFNNRKPEESKILESSAKSHFEKEIWPVEKAKIIGA